MNFIYHAIITLEYLWFSLILALSKNNMGCKGRQQLKVIGVGLPRLGRITKLRRRPNTSWHENSKFDRQTVELLVKTFQQ